MGKMENWLAFRFGSLRPRFKIAESIKKGLAELSRPTDIADLVKADERSLRKVVEDLGAKEEEPGTIHLVRPVRPAPMQPNPMTAPIDQPCSYATNEQVLRGDLDEARRQLAASESRVTQLSQRLNFIKGMAGRAEQLVQGDNLDSMLRLKATIADILKTSAIGTAGPVTPLAGMPTNQNEDFVDNLIDKTERHG